MQHSMFGASLPQMKKREVHASVCLCLLILFMHVNYVIVNARREVIKLISNPRIPINA